VDSHTIPEQTVEAKLLGAETMLRMMAGSYSPESTNAKPRKCPMLSPDARFRALIEQIPAVVFLAQMEGGLGEAYVSPQIEMILGFKQEEWLARISI
jgi:hypothetical protein